jgi:diguanylate cyclase (GGDEF)-like protein
VKWRIGRQGALPTAVVLIVVVATGSRMIYLSVQHHAAVARVSAAGVAAGYTKKIEPALQRLAALARDEADGAATLAAERGRLGTLEPPAGVFWMGADDGVLGARAAEAVAANGIAEEWKSAEELRAAPPGAVLGPLRLGSEWILAVRAPIAPAVTGAASGSKAWAVAYADLEELIADAHLARLIDAGYDFEVSQVESRSASARIFASSSTEPLTDTVAARIGLPTASAVPGSYLQLTLRPRAGWFPSSLLTSEIALLAFLSWLLAFGTYDMNHALQRAHAAVAIARRRLHLVNQQLAGEMQQRLALQETFDHALFHDTFTGLPNRRYFMDQLDRALREVRSKRRARIAIIIIDISRFKLINHLLGHTAGDDLMVQAARRFEERTSGLDGTLARWGGDQFSLMVLDVASADAAVEIANALQEQLRSPFQLRRHQLSVAATLGVTCIESGQERAEDIMREADIALSVAKRQETTKAILYAPDMGGQSADLVSLDADLHLALQKGQLRLLFQPIVDLGTFKMVGAEALLRWRHPVEGMLTPDRFLRNAEEAGLMVPITRWVIQRVVGTLADWRRKLPADQKFYISFNLSPAGLRDSGLPDYLASLLKEKELPASLIKIELTELALVGNVAAARETLERLHQMGIQLMLDDFGTGYSSLSNLQLFPFDLVKIDCPFVDSRGVFQANMSMVAAMLQLAGSLDLTSIAEIIEGEAAAAALKAMGCRYGQGYYFSRPIDAESALEKLRAQSSFEPAPSSSGTMIMSPLKQDGSQTLILRRLQESPEQTAESADTVIVRPLDKAAGTDEVILTAKRGSARADPPGSDPKRARPLSEDTSATVLMPMEMLNFRDEDDEDEDDDE